MKVKSLPLSLLHAASHVEFMQAALQLINTTPELRIEPLKEVLTKWSSEVDIENNLVRRQRASALTPKIAEADKLRDNAMYEFFFTVEAGLKSADNTLRESAQLIEFAIRPYRKDAYDQLTDQTQDVDGMLAALTTDANIEAADNLNLGPVISRLRTANLKFKDLYAQRIAESESRSAISSVKTPQQRRLVNSLYHQATDLLQAGSLILPAADREAVEKVISSLNALIDQYKLVISNQSKTRSNDDRIDSEVDRLKKQAAQAEIKKQRLAEKAEREAQKAAEKLRAAQEKEKKRK